jgi:tRNA(Ile)-lysidine synthase
MLLDQVRHTINRFGLLDKNDLIVVGVSGGPDSVALLTLLKSLAKEYGLRLHAAHLDHMLREKSCVDARFVKDLCVIMNIPVTIKKIDIRRLTIRGSVEEIARDQRLAFLCQIAKKIKANKIALGHTLDDQAETVLMRLIRGTGLYGLASILPKRVINGYTIIRPLIEIKRKNIESFLRRKRIVARIDESNTGDNYLRNRIRHHLLPLLEKKYNYNIKDILSNTAHVAAYDYDYLFEAAYQKTQALGQQISLKKFKELHPSMQKLVLRLNFQRLKGSTRTISYRHIQELEDLIANRPVNSIVDLPGNISVIKKRAFFFFFKR